MGILDRLIERLSGYPKEETTMIFSLGNDSEEVPISSEETFSSIIAPDQMEKLFKVDPLVFRAIEEYVYGIATNYRLNGGNENEVLELKKWLDEMGFLFYIQDAIQDILIYGNHFAYINIGQDRFSIKTISPKNVEFVRNPTTNAVEKDENGKPIGYIFTYGSNKIEISKESIKVNGEVKIKSKKEDLRTRVIHFKLWTYSDSVFGITPLMSAHKSAVIRLNLSDSIGETGFRGGGLVAYVPSVLPEKDRKRLSQDLKQSTSKNIFLLDERIKLDTVPVVNIEGRDKLVYYYADEVCAGLGVPLQLLMTGASTYSRERELLMVKFEQIIKALQLKLSYQIKTQIFSKFWVAKGFNGEIPDIIFEENTTYSKLTKSRTVATYARRGLITRDPEVEMSLRGELGIPVSKYLRKEKEIWDKDENRIPEKATEEIDKQL